MATPQWDALDEERLEDSLQEAAQRQVEDWLDERDTPDDRGNTQLAYAINNYLNGLSNDQFEALETFIQRIVRARTDEGLLDAARLMEKQVCADLKEQMRADARAHVYDDVLAGRFFDDGSDAYGEDE